MQFGEKIQLLLRKNRMTQKELASKINTTEVSISRYINNARLPKGDVVAKIAAALGTTSDFLLSEDEAITLQLPTNVPEDKSGFSFKEICDLAADERELLYNYRLLSQDRQNLLITMSLALVNEQNKGRSGGVS